jgi:hypothetical protein
MFETRQARLRALETLERRTKQFRSREDSWPFRMPHEPLDLDAIVEDALAGEEGAVRADTLKSRTVLRLEWNGGSQWELFAITLPNGLHIYCDTDGHETRVLASAKRGNPGDADGFFLERLAESRGELFGIEMQGGPPERIRCAIGDREFLADVFVDLFEGSDAELRLRAERPDDEEKDFRRDVAGWLARVLTAPPRTRRQPRVREQLDNES